MQGFTCHFWFQGLKQHMGRRIILRGKGRELVISIEV
jgi:hypothetical protein